MKDLKKYRRIEAEEYSCSECGQVADRHEVVSAMRIVEMVASRGGNVRLFGAKKRRSVAVNAVYFLDWSPSINGYYVSDKDRVRFMKAVDFKVMYEPVKDEE